jgi:hypothetical protein
VNTDVVLAVVLAVAAGLVVIVKTSLVGASISE